MIEALLTLQTVHRIHEGGFYGLETHCQKFNSRASNVNYRKSPLMGKSSFYNFEIN